MNARHVLFIFFIGSLAILLALPAPVSGQTPPGTAFTYQGMLKELGVEVTSTADFECTLWDAAAGGSMIGSVVTTSNVSVVDGQFKLVLDFGIDAFRGEARWLEIAVRVPHDPTNTAPYETLSPRQELTPAPYAIHAAGGVPLGTVIDWWRPNSTFPIPDGYLLCDGGIVADPLSQYNGATLPDLRNVFVRGAPTASAIGQTGGSGGHSHTSSLGDHDHAMNHGHGLIGDTGAAGTGATSASGTANTGAASTANTGTSGGNTSSSPPTTSSTTGSTGSASSSSTGSSGSGSTGSTGVGPTAAASSHTHKTFRYSGDDSRIWYSHGSTGSEFLLVNYANNAGITLNTIGEDIISPGIVTGGTANDTNLYTNSGGGHSHSVTGTHFHSVSSHSHSMAHTHGVAPHDHNMSHAHTVPTHSHTLGHTHPGPSHTHAGPSHTHTSGTLSAGALAGPTGPGGAASIASTSEAHLPPYVGLLKIMRIR